ncbi:MAG: YgjV family protein [Ruminococcaceae bacterium]|nr:YgjV family protein [Oscillospiraceae bacterium]
MELSAYILSILALVMMTLPSALKGKNMKGILVLLCLGNAMMGTSYLLEGSINGAVSSYIGVLTTAINFTFEVKNKPIPKWLIGTYMGVSVVMNVAASGGVDLSMLLVIGAAIAYQMSVTRKSGAQYRIWILFNILLWCVYDVVSESYGALITHGVQLGINIVSMLVYDRKTQKPPCS